VTPTYHISTHIHLAYFTKLITKLFSYNFSLFF